MEEQEDSAAKSVDRRSALKKAGAVAGVTAGAWVAPRVEGLSIIPDYASAGTGMGTLTITRMQQDCPDPPWGAQNQCWGTCGPGDSCSPVTVPLNIGGATGTINYSGKADTNADGNFNIVFDPPFNMCTFSMVNGQSPGPGSFGQDVTGVGSTNLNIDQSPVNQGNNVSFTITCA